MPITNTNTNTTDSTQVGNPVKVLYDDENWYQGTITHYNTKTKEFSIGFDDGEETKVGGVCRHLAERGPCVTF